VRATKRRWKNSSRTGRQPLIVTTLPTLAAFYTPAADLIYSLGIHVKGRDAIERDFADYFAKTPMSPPSVEQLPAAISGPTFALRTGAGRNRDIPNKVSPPRDSTSPSWSRRTGAGRLAVNARGPSQLRPLRTDPEAGRTSITQDHEHPRSVRASTPVAGRRRVSRAFPRALQEAGNRPNTAGSAVDTRYSPDTR
jgi:hypothetical protein